MKKLLLVAFLVLSCSLIHAEIITNSKGEKIDLKPNGTWVKVKTPSSGKNTILKDGDSPTINIKDGNDKAIPVTVYIKVEGESQKILTLKDLASNVDFTGYMIKLKLKNKYSFTPRKAMATLEGDSLRVFMEYTAKNSYGAEVVGHDGVNFVSDEDGGFKPAS